MSKPSKQAWLYFIILSLIWGSAFILIKKSLLIFSPTQVALIRIVAGFITLSALAIPSIKYPLKKDWIYISISGFMGSLLPAFLFAEAQTQVSSSTAGVLSALTPAFTVIISLVFFKGKVTSKNVVGLALGFLGAASLIFLKPDGNFEFNNPKALLIVVATICYAANLNLVKFKLHHLDAMHTSSLSLLVVGPLAALVLFNTNFVELLDTSNEVLFSLGTAVILGITSTGLALVIFFKLIKITSPIFSSSITYALPFVALMLGLWDGEMLSPGQFGSMTIIILGIYLTR